MLDKYYLSDSLAVEFQKMNNLLERLCVAVERLTPPLPAEDDLTMPELVIDNVDDPQEPDESEPESPASNVTSRPYDGY